MTAAVIDGDLTPVDFVTRSGDTFVIKATTTDKAGAIVNISGAAIKFGLYTVVDNGEVLTKTVGSGIVITDGVIGLYEVTVDAADTAALAGRHFHETEMIVSSTTRTVMVGVVNIKTDRVNA